MPNNVVWPRPVFIDPTTGTVAAGGTLSTYAAGTTTPKATYPTEANLNALTSPNPTSMTLNAAGSPTVDLWLNGSYKFVVQNSAAVTIYTSDNINDPSNILDANGNIVLGIGSGSFANYVNITGAATGVAPAIAFKGSDTNVNGTLTCQGTGSFTLASPTIFSSSTAPICQHGITVSAGGIALNGGNAVFGSGTALQGPSGIVPVAGLAGFSGGISLGENTSNGSNTYTIQAPASFASNLTLTLPTTAGSNTNYLSTNGSGTLSWAALPTTILGSAGCCVTMSATQTINSGSNATLQFNTKLFDILSEFNTGTFTYTATNPGTYMVLATVPANDSSTTTVGEVALNLQKNGTTVYSAGGSNPANTNWSVTPTIAMMIQLVATDALRLNWASVNANYSVGALGSGSIATANATFSVIRMW